MKIKQMQFAAALFALEKTIKITAARNKEYRERIENAPNFIAQIRVKDDSQGRYYIFKNGKLSSQKGIHPSPDVLMTMETAEIAIKLMGPTKKQLDMINAMKEMMVNIEGDDHLMQWFGETLNMIEHVGSDYGIDMGKGVTRYVNCTNGGAVHVDVKDGKILRIIPIEFDDDDAASWTIEARGKKFTPPRKTLLSSYAHSMKSIIYCVARV